MFRLVGTAGRLATSVGVRHGSGLKQLSAGGLRVSAASTATARLCSSAQAPKWSLDVPNDTSALVVENSPDHSTANQFAEIQAESISSQEVLETKPQEFGGLPLSDELKNKLRSKSIEKLFPVQEQCFAAVIDEKDLIVRSRTGTGKTLAFALPIVTKLVENPRRGNSTLPRALVLAPTRELARQVQSEIEWLDPSLRSACLYGGASIGPQIGALRRGVDIVVGTPGRLVDLTERGALDLSTLEICVLDEADEMLQVGFAKELDEILSRLPSERQMLLFSATVPSWVQEVSCTHMTSPTTIDLVGTEQIKTSDTIKHIAMMVQPAARLQILGDVLTVHGGDRAIVFVPTKMEADSVASSSLIRDDCCVLHGDINQAGREIALAGFRSGRYRNLIATDVAARGIDIPDVDLVVQYTMPDRGSTETYIHRSGRTGRAGKSGTSIVFYTERDKQSLGMVERSIGVEIDRVGPPHLNDVLEAASKRVRAKLLSTPDNLVEQFVPEAEKYLDEIEQGESNVKRAVAAALARVAGYDAPVTERSILSYKEGNTAVVVEPIEGVAPREMFLSRHAVQNMILKSLAHVDELPKIGRIVTYRQGAVFDIPTRFASVFETGGLRSRDYQARIATSLPESALDAMLDADGGRQERGGRGRSYGKGGGHSKNGRGFSGWGRNGRYGASESSHGATGRFEGGRYGRSNSGRHASFESPEFPEFERRRGRGSGSSRFSPRQRSRY